MSKPTLALLLSSIVALGALPVAGLAPTEDPRPETAPETLPEVRQLLEQGHYGQAIERLAQHEGIALPPAPAVADGAAALVALSEGGTDRAAASAVLERVPLDQREPAERILVALAQADLLVDQANAAGGAVGLDQVLRAAPGWRGVTTAQAMPTEAAPNLTLEANTTMEEGPYYKAQALVLSAVEESLPVLQRSAASPRAGLIDLSPWLIIGSTSNDVYGPEDDAILILELGGSDTYNNAQGSPWLVEGGVLDGTTFPEIIVDLTGDDTYVREVLGATADFNLTVQGAGAGGIGGIVDVLGADEYVARAVAETNTSNGSVGGRIIAQGAGAGGVGFLIDADGSDCIDVEAVGFGEGVTVVAQGAGSVGIGLAAFLGTSAPAPECAGGPSAIATVIPRVLSSPGGGWAADLGHAEVIAQGASLVGVGIFVGGLGDHAYTALADGGVAEIEAQGASSTGVGLLLDIGGSETYRAEAVAESNVSIIQEGHFRLVFGFAEVVLGNTRTTAQGAALDGVGVLADIGLSPDTYRAHTTASATALVRSITTWDKGTTSAQARVSIADTETIAQGAAVTGVGVLLDVGLPDDLGGDTNDVRNATTYANANATAVALGGAENGAFTDTDTGDVATLGQGYGETAVGLLVEVGGNDEYRLDANLTAVSSATADPSNETEELDTGDVYVAGQAQAVSGVGGLVDLDGEDTYVFDPGTTNAGDDRCWSNSEDDALGFGIGLDTLSTGLIPSLDNCPQF